MNKFYLFSPLEQFEIFPIFYIPIIDLAITNQLLILGFIVFLLINFFYWLVKPTNLSLYLVPNRWQLFLEKIYEIVLGLVLITIEDNKRIPINQANQGFPLIFSIFLFILTINLIGLVPYSFTLTSQLASIFSFSLALFIGVNIICIKYRGLQLGRLFIPAGCPKSLEEALIAIEFVSYASKPFSLTLRLFCNMLAGHILLKVFSGFSWSLMSVSGFSLFYFLPLTAVITLLFFEFVVAFIQAYVFCLLISIYLHDAVNLH